LICSQPKRAVSGQGDKHLNPPAKPVLAAKRIENQYVESKTAFYIVDGS
jgi:hypothetical protein